MKYCLGTVQFGQDYGIQGNGRAQRNQIFEMLDYAIDNGITCLDTAQAYGEAEKILGEYLQAHPDKKDLIQVVSKLKPEAFDSNDTKQWSKSAIRNAEQSLVCLGIQKFAAYLSHKASSVFEPDEINALAAVKAAGLTERIGVSVYTPDEAMRALEYSVVDAIQVPYNLFDHRLDSCGFFREAKRKGVQVFVRSTLLQGLLVMDPAKIPERVSFAQKYLADFKTICDEYLMSPLNVAVTYVRSKKEVDYVVFGVDNLSQLKEYISIKDSSLPLDLVEKLNDRFCSVEERVVNPVFWN